MKRQVQQLISAGKRLERRREAEEANGRLLSVDVVVVVVVSLMLIGIT